MPTFQIKVRLSKNVEWPDVSKILKCFLFIAERLFCFHAIWETLQIMRNGACSSCSRSHTVLSHSQVQRMNEIRRRLLRAVHWRKESNEKGKQNGKEHKDNKTRIRDFPFGASSTNLSHTTAWWICQNQAITQKKWNYHPRRNVLGHGNDTIRRLSTSQGIWPMKWL